MLTLEGRNMIFKNLAISKIVYLALKTNLPKLIDKQLENKFYGKTHVLKQNKSLSNIFENGGLKNVDTTLKAISLQCSWVKKLYDGNFHESKVIPLH